MVHTLRALNAFEWFFHQSVTVGGLGSVFFWFPFLLLVSGLVGAWKIAVTETRRLWILLTLPAMWITTGLLGGYYWLDWHPVPGQYVPMPHSPPWVEFSIRYGIFAFLLAGLITILYLRGARLFATVYFVVNLYFMIAMTFLAGMAVTGDWL
jgi:hypothetical protein